MHVVFRTNLGLADATKLGLEFKKCQIGMEADVPKDAAEALLKAGTAVDSKDAADDELIVSHREEQAKQEAAKAKPVEGVSKPAAVTAPHAKHDK